MTEDQGPGDTRGGRSALIIATGQYEDPALRRLRGAAADVDALAGVLSDPAVGGFDLRTVVDQPAYVVAEAIEEFFADRAPDDLLLVHVSGHGVKNQAGELHFAATNTRLNRLGSTAVAARFVNDQMSASRSRRIVLFLDCCYAGAFERGMARRGGNEVDLQERFGGRGRAVITASGALEYAFDGNQLTEEESAQPSVFTSAMVGGLLSGEADRNQDGWVGLDELYEHVYDAVRAVTPHQTPGKWTFGVQGDLRLARRSTPVTEPSPLPAELQQSVESPLAAVRAGAVQELARLAAGTHAGLALGARLALDRLADDDSRTVMTAATAALDALADEGAAPPAEIEPREPDPHSADDSVGRDARTEATHAGPPDQAPREALPRTGAGSEPPARHPPASSGSKWAGRRAWIAMSAVAVLVVAGLVWWRLGAEREPTPPASQEGTPASFAREGGNWVGDPVIDDGATSSTHTMNLFFVEGAQSARIEDNEGECLDGRPADIRGTESRITMSFPSARADCSAGTMTATLDEDDPDRLVLEFDADDGVNGFAAEFRLDPE